MVSNSLVTRIGLRWRIHAVIAAAMFAVLYKQWLTTPVLQHVSIGRWRFARSCGCSSVRWVCCRCCAFPRWLCHVEQWLAYC